MHLHPLKKPSQHQARIGIIGWQAASRSKCAEVLRKGSNRNKPNTSDLLIILFYIILVLVVRFISRRQRRFAGRMHQLRKAVRNAGAILVRIPLEERHLEACFVGACARFREMTKALVL